MAIPTRLVNLASAALLAGVLALYPSRVLLHVQVAAAATTCSFLNNANHKFDGTDPLAVQDRGAEATLDTQQTNLCTTTDGQAFTTTWALVTGNGANDGWAQSGIYLDRNQASGSLHYFASTCEYSNSTTGCSNVWIASPLPSSNHTYQEVYNSSSHHIDMKYDSTVIQSTSFDPTSAWTDPWFIEFNAESNDTGNDVTGTSTSKELIGGMKYLPCTTCSWTTPTGMTLSSNYSRYTYQWLTTNSDLYIWTN